VKASTLGRSKIRRSKIVFPLVSIIVLAQSAYAEERVHPDRGPHDAHFARGHLPARAFGGHPFHGRLAWEDGAWRHEIHNGRLGWWWDVGGAWYFYPQRLEGPPTYVSEDEFLDDGPVPVGPPVAGDAPPPGAYAPAPPPGAYAPPPPVAYAPPPPPPPAPDPAAGAVGGAIAGGVIGGLLTGRPVGAVAGAIAGGTTGAIISAQAARRPGYYWSQGACYYRYPSGQYVVVDPRSCG
jgi:hypothetical protein